MQRYTAKVCSTDSPCPSLDRRISSVSTSSQRRLSATTDSRPSGSGCTLRINEADDFIVSVDGIGCYLPGPLQPSSSCEGSKRSHCVPSSCVRHEGQASGPVASFGGRITHPVMGRCVRPSLRRSLACLEDSPEMLAFSLTSRMHRRLLPCP